MGNRMLGRACNPRSVAEFSALWAPGSPAATRLAAVQFGATPPRALWADLDSLPLACSEARAHALGRARADTPGGRG